LHQAAPARRRGRRLCVRRGQDRAPAHYRRRASRPRPYRNSWDNRGAGSSGPQLYRTGFTTDLNETDIVFGGEKHLFKAVKEIIAKYDPPAVFVYQTCVPAMIGDDIDAVCKAAAEKFGTPVIPINSPGFVGPKNLHHAL